MSCESGRKMKTSCLLGMKENKYKLIDRDVFLGLVVTRNDFAKEYDSMEEPLS